MLLLLEFVLAVGERTCGPILAALRFDPTFAEFCLDLELVVLG